MLYGLRTVRYISFLLSLESKTYRTTCVHFHDRSVVSEYSVWNVTVTGARNSCFARKASEVRLLPNDPWYVCIHLKPGMGTTWSVVSEYSSCVNLSHACHPPFKIREWFYCHAIMKIVNMHLKVLKLLQCVLCVFHYISNIFMLCHEKLHSPCTPPG